MDNITRVCRKCGQEKPLSEFVNNKMCALGHAYTCKQCASQYMRKWRADNSEKVRENSRKQRITNPEKVREKSRKWYAANPEKVREKSRKYRRKAREELSYYYLKRQLKTRHLPITPEMIDYKRIQLKLYREIKNQQNDERD